jgi:hypothetical protein
VELVNSTPVVVTLWDYGFFRSLRVATAQITAGQLLATERVGIATVELKPMGLSAQTIQLSMTILALNEEREWRPRRASIVSTVAAVDAASSLTDDNSGSTTIVTRTKSAGFPDLDPFAVDGPYQVVLISALALLICTAVLWLHSLGHLVVE